VPLPGGDRLHLAAPALRVRTTKPGRSFASEPRPYQTHEPAAGRPEIWTPVFMKVWRVVVDLLRLQRAHDADLVGDRADLGQERRHLLAGGAVAGERVLGPKHLSAWP